MAEKRVIELEVKSNDKDVQNQFDNLRTSIQKTTKEVEDLSNKFGENSKEADEARKELSQLTQAYDTLSKSATDLGAKFEDVYGELQPLTTRMGEAEDRLYELALAGKQGTKEYNDLLESVSKYRKVQIQTDMVVDASATTMNQKLLGAVGGVAAGFEVAEGAAALFGVESSKLQETMVKLQAVMAVSQGIQGLKEASSSFKALGASAKTALQGIRTGIAATGIGLFVVALGTVVAYWDDIKDAVSGVSAEQEKLNKKTDANLKASEEKVNALNKQDNILKLQGKSEKEILNLKLAALDTTIQNAKINVANQKATKIAQVEAAKRNKEILEGIIMFITIPIQTILGTIDAVSEGLAYIGAIDKGLSLRANMTNYLANLVFDPVATAAEGDAAIKAAEDKLTELLDQQAAFKLQIKSIEQQSTSGSIQNTKAAAKETLDLERQLIDKRLALMKDGYEKEVAIAKERSRREREDLLASAKDKIVDKEQLAEAEKLIDQTLKKELRELEDKYFSGTLKARGFTIEALKNDRAKELEIEVKANLEKAAKQKEFDEQEKARIKQLNEYRLNAAKDTLQIFSDLNELFAGKSEKQQKKAFQVQKAINIANAVIDTYKAANTALASSPPPFNYIAMAASITAGLLNVKKIASQEFQSSSTSGGGGSSVPSAPSSMTANFQTIGTSGINQLATLQQQPVQAYVVSGEVTSAQALDRNRVQNATL